MSYDMSMSFLDGLQAAANRRLTEQQTRVQKLAADGAEQEMAANEAEAELNANVAKRLQAIAQGDTQAVEGVDVDGDGTISNAERLRIVGDMMFNGGAVKRGAEFYDLANKVASDEAKITNDRIDASKKQLESTLMSADLVYRHLGTAQNQSEYDNAKNYLLASPALSEEEKQQIQTLPDEYNPQITRFLANQAISAKDKANIQLTERARDQQDLNLQQTQQYRMHSLAIDEARLEEQRVQNEFTRKGGKSASAPTDQELNSAKRVIENQLFGGEAPEDDKVALEAGAQAVASRAKQMVAENRGLDWNTALQRAFIESRANGDWTTVTTRRLGRVTDEKLRYQNKNLGKTAELALPMPVNEDGKVDPTQFVKGRYYITAQGRLRFNGKDFDAE